jgi:hypothetical protein
MAESYEGVNNIRGMFYRQHYKKGSCSMKTIFMCNSDIQGCFRSSVLAVYVNLT